MPTLAPIAGAIAVFGMLYGAAAQPLFGSWLTLASSVVIFSGTAQFSMVGLLAAGSGPLAVLWAVYVVNIRNVALGGAVRPHLVGGLWKRMFVSWFLIDETDGLALASDWPVSPRSWRPSQESTVSDLILILTVAVVTYEPRRRCGGLVTRIPAPLFASLAVFALVGDEVVVPEPATIGAAPPHWSHPGSLSA